MTMEKNTLPWSGFLFDKPNDLLLNWNDKSWIMTLFKRTFLLGNDRKQIAMSNYLQ